MNVAWTLKSQVGAALLLCLAPSKNLRCLTGAKNRCPFLPALTDEHRLLNFRDHAHASVKDIEDLVVLGKEQSTCPYYGSRAAIAAAEIVTLPYNLLLSARARESLGVKLAGNIVVVDEAHNLIDTVLSVHAASTSNQQVQVAQQQIATYLKKFGKRLKGQNAVWLKKFYKILHGIVLFCDQWVKQIAKDAKAGQTTERMITTQELVDRMGGADAINLLAMESYLKESKIAQKVRQ